MKLNWTVAIVFVLTALSVICLGRSVATPTPTPTPQPTATVQNPPGRTTMSDAEKLASSANLKNISEEFDSKGNWYLFFYYVLVIGAALASALAGLLLQWSNPKTDYKNKAAILAFVGSAFVIVMTYVDLSANARANKVAANQIIRLRLQVEGGDIKTTNEVDTKVQDIWEQKQSLALPKTMPSPSTATPTPSQLPLPSSSPTPTQTPTPTPTPAA